jgi:hypothetical protein
MLMDKFVPYDYTRHGGTPLVVYRAFSTIPPSTAAPVMQTRLSAVSCSVAASDTFIPAPAGE